MKLPPRARATRAATTTLPTTLPALLVAAIPATLLALLPACGGSRTTPAPAPGPGPAPGPAGSAPGPAGDLRPDAAGGDAVAGDGAADRLAPPRPAPRPDQRPELFPPPWKAVGVGQTISFATTAIDQDLDRIAVAVTAMPASARFDPITQTVTWKPDRADLAAGVGTFRLEVTDLDHPELELTEEWQLPVTAKKAPVPVAPFAGAEAETLFTIREPARVAATARAYPFDAMLALGATLSRPSLPADVVAALGPPDRKALFRSFLKGMAEIHGNPRLDPDAPGFDRATFGDPRDWRLVVVRPRIDKKFHELRLVYQAVKAPEPVFAMFRVRPVQDHPTLPPEARAENNRVFAALFWKHLLTADGAPSPALVKDRARHGKAVLAFVQGVLGHKGTEPWNQAGFVALPTEARMGGGSARNPDGSYAHGDGWAWSVMKPMVAPGATVQSYVNIPIPGFWTHTVPSADGASWIGKCAPAFDPDDPRRTPGWEVLCRKALGFVDLPDRSSGKVAPARIDAVNLFRDHKLGPAAANLALEDPRRDHGEENGMTCAQCHIRNFGVRDYTDARTLDPRAGVPTVPNRALPTLNFQIIPSHTWEAYTLEFMQDQACKTRQHLEAALGKAPALPCLLADPAAPRVTAPLPP
ncbi:MAG: hypothetical protein KJZ91_28765 [Myxococcales bacterium]|nr:hypothetical protein [Myxococcales bacterium]